MTSTQRKSGARPIAVLVGNHGSAKYLPKAFAKWGVDVVSVPGTTGDVQGTAAATAARLAACAPLCVVPGQESAVPLADALAEKLGLPGNGTRLSTARRDKYQAGEALRRAGVRSSEQFRGTGALEVAHRAAARGRFPVVVKPVGASASQGVTVCRDALEVRLAAEAILGSRNLYGEVNTHVLVEEFLTGEEFTVDTVSRDGRRYTAAIRRRHTRVHGTRVVHEYTSLIAPDHGPAAGLVAYTHEVLDALGVRHGPAHTDVIVTPGGPTLVEAGVRLGDGVLPGYDELCLGAGQADLTALSYTDPAEFLTRWAGRSYAKLREAQMIETGTETAGVVETLDLRVLDSIDALPSVYFFDARLWPGGRISPPVDRRGSTGVAYTLHCSPRQLERDRLRIRQLMGQVCRLRAEAAEVVPAA